MKNTKSLELECEFCKAKLSKLDLGKTELVQIMTQWIKDHWSCHGPESDVIRFVTGNSTPPPPPAPKDIPTLKKVFGECDRHVAGTDGFCLVCGKDTGGWT